jgi:hypothetical protein
MFDDGFPLRAVCMCSAAWHRVPSACDTDGPTRMPCVCCSLLSRGVSDILASCACKK